MWDRTHAAASLTLPPALWSDPDVRWLTGAHEAEGHTYLIQERYEELLWWLLLPSLMTLAGKTAPTVSAAAELSASVSRTLALAKSAGYRVDVLTGESSKPDQPVAAGPSEKASEATDTTEKPTVS